MEEHFGVSYKMLALDRHHILPHLVFYLQSQQIVRWPTSTSFTWNGAVGAIDCTSHPRCRPHPGHSFYYRGDKKMCFLSVQLVVDLAGSSVFSYDILRGHNNDQGCFFLIVCFPFSFSSSLRSFDSHRNGRTSGEDWIPTFRRWRLPPLQHHCP